MKLDYTNMRNLVEIRIKQIDEASKENPYFNKEYRELITIRDSVSNLIILERQDTQQYNEDFDWEKSTDAVIKDRADRELSNEKR